MKGQENMDYIKVRAKYDGKCRKCYERIPKGTVMLWHPDKRTAKHLKCHKAKKPLPVFKGRIRFVS